MQPTAIGPFKIERELGRGGMGEVYLARDTRLDRHVAIKSLPAHLASDPDRLARFQREAKVLASLNHSSIGAIYGLEEIGGQQYLILEFVEGETLADRLMQGPIPIDEALRFAAQIAEALELAHDKGVVHRDLKPGNVMITPDGAIKILDFGLARTEDGQPSSSAAHAMMDSPTMQSPARMHSPTIPGAIMGTVGYMSPEQARGKPVDKRSDIFSFGCVLSEMLSGSMPFRGETVADAIGATLHKEFDFALLPPNTPTRVRDLLASCLAKDRRSRLHDIGDARLEIERAIAGREWTAASASARPRRSSLSIALSVVAAVALLAIGAALWSALGPRAVSSAEPTCVSVAMPDDIVVAGAMISNDGRTLVIQGRPKSSDTSGPALPRLYTRRLDSYEFKPVAGTEGLLGGAPTRDSRSIVFGGPVSPGALQRQLSIIPIDGSAPATTVAQLTNFWTGLIELENGDVLIGADFTSLIRIPKAGGIPSSPVAIDCGRPGVQRYELVSAAFPGDRAAFVNVVSYGARGFQYSIGVMDLMNGRVKVVVEDGGNAVYSPTGHVVFARGNVILAAPFDIERTEVRGAPVAVWSGLKTPNRAFPGFIFLTERGALCYEPDQNDAGRPLAVLEKGGILQPWSSDHRHVGAVAVSPDGSRVICQATNARGIDELWISPLDHADLVKLGSEANADSFSPTWSPDGRRIAYMRVAQDDRDGVYIRDVEGGEARRVLKLALGEFVMPTAWLANDSAILLSRFTAGKEGMLLLPLGDAEVTTASLHAFLPSDFSRSKSTLSSDGKLLAFISDESGRAQSWVVEMRAGSEPGRPIQVRTSGSIAHAWSADGKSLFIQDERGRLMKVGVSAAPQLSISPPVEVADLEHLAVRTWVMLPDDRVFACIKSDAEDQIKRFDMVLNWTEILKAKVPVAR